MDSSWHGFSSFIQFLKASASLGLMLTTGLWFILTVSLDGRYATKEIEAIVHSNGAIASQVQTEISDLKLLWLQEQIFSLKIEQCAATNDRTFYARRIAELVRQYESIHGDRPQIPDCDDL